MSKKKFENSEGEDFLPFTGVSSDQKNKRQRNLAQELYSKNWQDETITAFEKQQGFVVKPAAKELVKHKVKVFSPENEKDKNLMIELMNSPNHKITYWKDNWTPSGEYRVFVIYSEIIPVDKEKDKPEAK